MQLQLEHRFIPLFTAGGLLLFATYGEAHVRESDIRNLGRIPELGRGGDAVESEVVQRPLTGPRSRTLGSGHRTDHRVELDVGGFDVLVR